MKNSKMQITKNNDAVLYCRVSSKEQEETGYSLPSQEKFLRQYASNKNLNIKKIFSISESASSGKQRKIFDKMLAYVSKHNINHIICEKVDRLTRNLSDAVLIDDWRKLKSNRNVHIVKNSMVLNDGSKSQEILMWELNVVLSKNYIDNLSEEVKKGQKEKLEQGYWPSHPPIGYMSKGEKGHKYHVPNPETAPFITKMFELYSSGNYSLSKLSSILYEEGLRSQKGKKVVKSRLSDYLSNPFYYGDMKWNGELYKGKHIPLISKSTFDKVQNIMKSKTTPKYSKHSYLYKGLIKCAECKGTITWEKQKGIIYGHCNHYKNCTQKKWVKEYEIEDQIKDAFIEFQINNKRLSEWIKKALKESHRDVIEYHKKALKKLRKQESILENRLEQLYNDKLDQIIDLDTYKRKFKQFSEERKTIATSINEHIDADTAYIQLGANIYDLSQIALDLYIKANEEEKRELISLVFDTLTLDEGVLSASPREPFKILVSLNQHTKSSKKEKIEFLSEENFEPGFSRQSEGAESAENESWLPG